MRRIAALALAVFAVGTLAACGDSGSSTADSSSTSKEASSQSGSKGSESKSGSKGWKNEGSQSKQSDGSGESKTSSVHAAPLKVSGGSSTQFRNPKGGDNSIQDFGEESDESELEEAATSLHDFYVARAEGDWSAACSQLAKTVIKQLEMLGSRSDQLDGKGCAGILEAMTPPLPAAVLQESTIVDAGSLRTEGEQAFLIYRGAEGTIYAIPMKPEGGGWKVGALAATPIS
jgi:hypothetical protein